MAQVNFLKSIADSAGWGEMQPTDDLTLNSFTGDGSGLTNLDMDNASSGILDKAFYDSSMAGTALNFAGGVLNVLTKPSEGIGVDGSGLFVDYDGTTIGMTGNKLSVIASYATETFQAINFITEDDIVASILNDTINIVAGTNMSITTVAATNTITFAAAGGGGGTYFAGTGLIENPSGTFNIDYTTFNNWNNTQRISSFNGIKLDIQATAADATPLIRVQDSTPTTVFTVDKAGYVVAQALWAQGDVQLGTTSAQTIEVNGLIVNDIIPDVSNTRALGASGNRWEDIFVDDLIGNAKTVAVDNLLDKTVAETLTGHWSFSNNLTVGSTAADILIVNSVISSNLIPNASNTRTLGSSGNRWEDLFVDDIVDTNGAIVPTTAFQMIPLSGTSKPAASSSVRGHVYTTEGGAGVADVTEICLKSSADTYSWVNLATG